MKALITGHSGYIGTVLCEMLRQSGHDVVGIDIDLYSKCTFGPDVATPIPSIDDDLRDLTVTQLKGFDAILHLAGVCNDRSTAPSVPNRCAGSARSGGR